MLRFILVGLLAFNACGKAKVGTTPTGDPVIPGDNNSGGGDTTTGDPITGDPIAGDPLPGDPLPGDPLAGDPLAGDPLPGDPLAGDPLPGDPIAGDPIAGDPIAGDPIAGDPIAGDPIAGDPFLGDPIASGDFASCTPDGPHVSNTTCALSNQCGTVERPWCTIQGGIDNSASSPVMVAGVSDSPYVEAIVMADSIDVEGGHNTRFTARDPDPATNGAVIRIGNVGVTFPADVTATLNGFTILDGAATSEPSDLSAVIADGAANVTLTNIDAQLTQLLSGALSGVAVGAGDNGSLTITDCSFDIGDSDTSSVGIFAAPAFTGPITMTNTDVQSGAANNSHGVRAFGPGTLSVTGGSIRAGNAEVTSRGIQANHASATMTLTDVTVHGGQGNRAYGVDVAVSEFTVNGGRFTGGGDTMGANREAFGIRAAGTGVTIDGATIVGAALGASGLSPLDRGIGIQITGGDDATPTAFISNSTIEGGGFATERLGLVINGVQLDLQSSTVSGSTSAGGVRAIGVSIIGMVPLINAEHTVSNNASIVGGAPMSSNTGAAYEAVGVFINTSVPTTVANNHLLQACTPTCQGPGFAVDNLGRAVGVLMTRGTGHLIDSNLTILGGPLSGDDPTFTSHAGIAGILGPGIGSSAPIEAEISANDAIAGNQDATLRPANVFGILGQNVDLLIDSNPKILGGFGTATATGIGILQRISGVNSADITNNSIFGGGAPQDTGMFAQTTALVVTGNVIDACGLASSTDPAPECLANISDGLVSIANPSAFISNNFVFGGYGNSAEACVITAPALSSGGAQTTTVYNLCLSPGRAVDPGGRSISVGLTVEAGGSALSYVFRNNIISAGSLAFTRHGVFEGGAVTGITFENNNLIPDTTVDEFVSYYLHATDGELDTVGAIDALDDGTTLLYGPTGDVAPSFLAPTPMAPSAAGYHLDDTCALRDLAQEITAEDVDFDGETRGVSTSTANPAPEIGPDECP